MEKKPFKDILKVPPRRYRTPEDQVKKSSPGSRYSAAYEYASPTEADMIEMQKTQQGQELQQRFNKDLGAEINEVEHKKRMSNNPYLNGGRKTRRRRSRKSRRSRKH